MYKHSYLYSLLGEDKKEKSTRLAGAKKSLKDGAGTHSRLPAGLEQSQQAGRALESDKWGKSGGTE